jgi:DNA-binding CsgD family transcriptional regulator
MTSTVTDVTPDVFGLTAREFDVLLCLSQGLTARAIARRLGCSVRTVSKHCENLYRKLGVNDRLRAVLDAQQRGLLAGPGSLGHG